MGCADAAGDFERVKSGTDLRAYASDHLKQSRGGYWCCPSCGSGSHGTADSDGALSIAPDGKSWKCFSCGEGGDIFDLTGIIMGTDNRGEQLREVAGWAGIDLEGRGSQVRDDWRARSSTKEDAPDYRAGRSRHAALIADSRARIGDAEAVGYLASRGIDREAAERWGLGYLPEKQRIVIPYPGSGWYHADRDVTGRAAHKYEKPRAAEVGPEPIWDRDALFGDAVAIVEGQLDALATADAGVRAIAMGGASNAKKVADAAREAGFSGVALIMTDADAAGDEAAGRLTGLLEGFAHPWRVEMPEGVHDPFEWFARDAEGMRSALSAALDAARADAEEGGWARFAASFGTYGDDLRDLMEAPEPLPTGIPALDDALNGGLFPGLTVMFAEPGAGKSSLALQIARNVAYGGGRALYVSIEMPRRECIARLASCLIYEAGLDERYRFGFAEWAAQGRDAAARAARGEEPDGNTAVIGLRLLHDACPGLAVADGERGGDVGTLDGVRALIGEAARRGASLVAVDYLQFIDAGQDAPRDQSARFTAISHGIAAEAKRCGIPVLGLSSVTKDGAGKLKDGRPDMQLSKGSSDFASDAVAVIGLSHDRTVMAGGNTVLSAYVMKNRNGIAGGADEPVQLAFWGRYGYAEGL